MADKAAPRIPVVMFHAVGIPLPGWKWPTLTSPYELFEAQVDLLASRGYRFLPMDDYPAQGGKPSAPDAREVILTFDDGYLDNWVFAYPILKRRGMRGTVFVNPEFIDPSDEPRPTLEDVWAGRCALGDLQSHGFLNRAELRSMAESGVLDIASHTMSHTWHWTGPEIVGFHNPREQRPWLGWNARPDRKFAYLVEDQSGFTPWGAPIYANGRSLGIRRFFPHPSAGEACAEHVAQNGGTEFFERADWADRLRAVADESAGEGRMETDAERDERYRYEIDESRRLLAEITGHSIDHHCWPGGAYCDASWDIAAAREYRTMTVASWDRRRWTQDDPRWVHRIGCGLHVALRKNLYQTDDPHFLYLACEYSRGRRDVLWPLRFRKLLQAVRNGFKPAPRELA